MIVYAVVKYARPSYFAQRKGYIRQSLMLTSYR